MAVETFPSFYDLASVGNLWQYAAGLSRQMPFPRFSTVPVPGL